MEIDSQPAAGPSTFRPTPALGVTYLLDMEEEDVKIIPTPLPPVDNPNDGDYDPRADQDIDEEDDPEEGPPYPTPSSIVHGKRKATEVYDVDDEEEPRQSDRLRKKKTRLGKSRAEPEYICISSDSDNDDDCIVQIPKPESTKKQKRRDSPPEPPVAASKQESEEDAEPRDESSASPDLEAETGSVERLRPDTPKWLDVQLAKTRRQFPGAKLEISYHYSIDGDVWRVKCKTCSRIFCTGPGQHLVYLHKHLSGVVHQTAIGNIPTESAGSSNDTRATRATPRRDPSPRLAPDRGGVDTRAAASRRHGHGREHAAGQEGGDGDDVERFLDQLGLPADLAPKLRSFGFEDDKRMSRMGRLSDETLALLLEHLTKQGVELVPALMVREGLKRRAGTL
ncbi:hypothetical protein V8D89_012214 [Ganoderma adspersum]